MSEMPCLVSAIRMQEGVHVGISLVVCVINVLFLLFIRLICQDQGVRILAGKQI